MNTKTLFSTTVALATFSAITLLTASTAFAYDNIGEPPVAYTSTVSRADVKAEAVRARAAGEINLDEYTFVIAATGSTLTRAQVKAEALEALRIGVVGDGDRTLVPTQAQLDSIRLAGQRAIAMTVASR